MTTVYRAGRPEEPERTGRHEHVDAHRVETDEAVRPADAPRARHTHDDTPEPDEPGEGLLTRTSETGGIEPRILSDHDDPTLGEEIAGVTDEPVNRKRGLKGTLPPPPA